MNYIRCSKCGKVLMSVKWYKDNQNGGMINGKETSVEIEIMCKNKTDGHRCKEMNVISI